MSIGHVLAQHGHTSARHPAAGIRHVAAKVYAEDTQTKSLPWREEIIVGNAVDTAVCRWLAISGARWGVG